MFERRDRFSLLFPACEAVVINGSLQQFSGWIYRRLCGAGMRLGETTPGSQSMEVRYALLEVGQISPTD